MAKTMAMGKQQPGGGGGGGGGSTYSNWDAMLKRLNPDGTYRSPLSDGTHSCPPSWSWVSKDDLGIRNHDIDDRVNDICSHVAHILACDEPQGEIVFSEDRMDEKEEAEFLLKREEERLYNPKHIERWLDELIKYSESNEVALILYSDGRLFTFLLRVLCNKHACIREKAAEFVTAMVQNNPWGQQFILEINGLDPLLHNVNLEPDATSKTKALGAISALIRNNKPSITAFRRFKGFETMKGALSSESVSLQRDALNLIQYILHENSSDCNIVTELELHCIMMDLASSDDAEVREAALRGLLVLARYEEGGDSGQLLKNDDKLKQVFQERIEGISAMAPEDLGAAREEIQLVDSLWNACYNEPSSLGEMGLLVLPGEDVPAPDVASKLFEPPLRAWADAEAADRNSVIEKDYNIVADLGLPCIMMHLVSSDDAKVREAALKGLLVLARDEEGEDSGQLVKNDDKLKQVLQERIERISAMTPEDLGVARREIQLVDSLWNACYNEPSSLGENDLLVLPGEDARRKLFEPPSAATPTVQGNSSSKRRKLHCL